MSSAARERSTTAFAPLAVEARDVACARGGRLVLSNLSFRLESGHMLAVLGPNGSGKSTLLRLLAGLLRLRSGRLAFEGRDDDRAIVHYLGHVDALKPALTLHETMRFWSVVYQQGRPALDEDFDEVAEGVGLRHALDLPVGVLSAGQRRRAALARLLLSPRPLWLLDEPAAPLDGDGETLLGRLMAKHLSDGGLIVAATHRDLPVPPDSIINLGALR